MGREVFNTVRGTEILLGKNAGLAQTVMYCLQQRRKKVSFMISESLEQRDAYEKLIVVSNKVTEQG